MEKNYFEHKERTIEPDERFKYVMALALNPQTNYEDGIIRCITSRVGDIQIKGYGDRSELYLVKKVGENLFEITDRLNIKNEKEILAPLIEKDWDFIGLEDPDIWVDPKTDLIHVYFTIPVVPKDKQVKSKIHLGHAFGRNLNSLEMTVPALMDIGDTTAKELSIAPINKKGFRYNLIESRDRQPEITYSTVRVAIARDMGEPWEYGDTVFHPGEHDISWIAGHASPGPLFSKDFLDIGEGKLVGLINGREANKKVGEKIFFGMFSVGLFIYDYENGKIEWVSSEPFIRDSEAGTITFASCFVATGKGKGVLYAHVDDSFVRAYDLEAEQIKKLLPERFLNKI